MKKTRKMVIVLLTVSMVAMLLSGCKKKELIVEESKESDTQVTVELPTVTKEAEVKEPLVSEVPEGGKEVVDATEVPTSEPTEEVTTAPEVTEEPEVTNAPTKEPVVTEAPKVTEKPTATPKPTVAPTPVPTAVPTAVPTQAPAVPSAPAVDPNYGVSPSTPTPAPTAVPQPGHTHSYGSGVVTKEANCGVDGVRTYTCSCGDTRTEAIPATGNHGEVYFKWYQYHTCHTGGSHSDFCKVCDAYLGTTQVDTTAHDFEATPGYAGDCSRPATFSQKCKVCQAPGETLYGEKRPDVHDWDTVYGEEWDNDLQQWVRISETYCGWCGDSKGVVRVE